MTYETAPEDIRRWAGRARIALAAMIIASLINVGSGAYVIWFVTRLAGDGFLDLATQQAVAEQVDVSGVVAGLVYLFAFVWAAFSFLSWTHKSVAAAQRLAPDVMRISPLWAVAWNFIPIASFWMPYRAIRQLSEAFAGPSDRSAVGAISQWWGMWVAANLLGVAAAAALAGPGAPTLEDLGASTAIDMVSLALMIGACFVLRRVIALVTAQAGATRAEAVF